MPIHEQSWALALIAGLAAIAAAALSGILGAPTWAIAATAAAGFAALAWFLLRAERSSRATVGRLRDALDQLRSIAGPAADRDTPETAEAAAARLTEVAAEIRRRIDALESRHARLLEYFTAMDEPVLALDDSGAVSMCNPAAERLFGVEAGRMIGRPVEEAFTFGELVRIHGQARAGRAVREQIRVATPTGAGIWEVAASPVAPAGQPAPPDRVSASYAVILTIRDVTELSRALQVKTDFVANASHELRTPIASLRVAVDTLAGLPDDEVRMRERLVGMIAGSISRLEDLIRDLLDLSRLESSEAGLRLERVAASELAAAIGSDLERTCRERRLTLSIELAPELEWMRTDRNLLFLILGNLVDNAAKFAFEGTTVRIVGTVWRDHKAGARSLGGLPAGPGVRFEVIDRGVGIPLSQQQRVFERFYQIDQARTGTSPRRGTGLGLAIVKHAARRLGGSVRLHSVWQQGTTVTVELPDCLEPPTPAPDTPARLAPPPQRSDR